VNGKYVLPDDQRFDDKFKRFIQSILVPDPRERPSIDEVIYMIKNYESLTWPLDFRQREESTTSQQAVKIDAPDDFANFADFQSSAT
jgi:hypothetical protein